MKALLWIVLFPTLLYCSPEEEITYKMRFAEYVIEDADYCCSEDVYGYYFYKGKIEAYQECLDILKKGVETNTP